MPFLPNVRSVMLEMYVHEKDGGHGVGDGSFEEAASSEAKPSISVSSSN